MQVFVCLFLFFKYVSIVPYGSIYIFKPVLTSVVLSASFFPEQCNQI